MLNEEKFERLLNDLERIEEKDNYFIKQFIDFLKVNKNSINPMIFGSPSIIESVIRGMYANNDIGSDFDFGITNDGDISIVSFTRNNQIEDSEKYIIIDIHYFEDELIKCEKSQLVTVKNTTDNKVNREELNWDTSLYNVNGIEFVNASARMKLTPKRSFDDKNYGDILLFKPTFNRLGFEEGNYSGYDYILNKLRFKSSLGLCSFEVKLKNRNFYGNQLFENNWDYPQYLPMSQNIDEYMKMGNDFEELLNSMRAEEKREYVESLQAKIPNEEFLKIAIAKGEYISYSPEQMEYFNNELDKISNRRR